MRLILWGVAEISALVAIVALAICLWTFFESLVIQLRFFHDLERNVPAAFESLGRPNLLRINYMRDLGRRMESREFRDKLDAERLKVAERCLRLEKRLHNSVGLLFAGMITAMFVGHLARASV